MRAQPRLVVASLAVLSLAAVLAAAALLPGGSAQAATGDFYVWDNVFCTTNVSQCSGEPQTLTINPGDSVQWTDAEGTVTHHHIHQCTSGTFVTCTGGFDSGDVAHSPGETYFASPIAFPDAGTYYFHCDRHTTMEGIIQVGPPVPSPTPSPTPAPTPTHSPSPTPGPTNSPTPTHSPSPTPSPTATFTVSPGASETATPIATPESSGIGDADCDGHLTPNDTLAILSYAAGTAPGPKAQGNGCAPIGEQSGLHVKGDVNCDGAVDVMDALVVLLAQAGLPLPLPSGCPGP